MVDFGVIMSTADGKQMNCEECGSDALKEDQNTGETVCMNCGYVISTTLIDQGPEWRAFDLEQQDKLTRVGAPLTLTIHDKGLSTTIGWQNRDAQGRRINPDDEAKIHRLRKWQRRTSVNDGVQRNLTTALSELNRMATKLNLPRNAVETAAMFYRQAIQKKLIRGRTIQSVVAATLYMACRTCGIIRNLDEISRVANITRKEAARNYRLLYKELQPTVPPVDRQNLITKLVNQLKLTGKTEMLARGILNQAAEQKLTIGRAPEGITAACIYISGRLTDEQRTQGEIARTARITEVTIRNRYKELMKNLILEVAV